MGREFGSAAARWCHLLGEGPVPEIVGVCDKNPASHAWFRDNFPSVKIATERYEDLLGSPDIDAIYCAVPHDQHERIYLDVIRAGKHLMGEKPFGIDLAANARILEALRQNPRVFARCSSEFPYFPAAQRLVAWARERRFGRIIEVKAGFHHSSDMDPSKPINWKRTVEHNGEYGCLGDLGIHTQHIPFRMGWRPRSVYAILSKIVSERPDGKGGIAPCLTWDNAALVCEAQDAGTPFPLTLETKRMSPGATNVWFIEVYGLKASARVSTADPRSFFSCENVGKEQPWSRVDMGYTPLYPSITGGIFEFGFPDAVLQMWASFLHELDGGEPAFGCFTPEETGWSHLLQTAALRSHRTKRAEAVVEAGTPGGTT
jgi:predicted dehydrogenase